MDSRKSKNANLASEGNIYLGWLNEKIRNSPSGQPLTALCFLKFSPAKILRESGSCLSQHFFLSFCGNLQHCLAQTQEKASNIRISSGHPDTLLPTKKDTASKDIRCAHKHGSESGKYEQGRGKKGRRVDDEANNISNGQRFRARDHTGITGL